MARMSKKEKTNLFVSLTRKQSREEIRLEEKYLGRKLSKEERHKVISDNAKRLKRHIAFASFFALGGIVGFGGNNLLQEAKSTNGLETDKKQITIDSSETDKSINIKNFSDAREVFINDYKINLDEIDTNESAYNQSLSEINNLKTPDEVLDYLKGIYVEKYNNQGSNITKNNIELYASKQNTLATDTAKNGDKIVRIYPSGKAPSNKGSVQNEYGTISVTIKDGDTIIAKEIASNYLGTNNYVPVYDENEEVESSHEALYGLRVNFRCRNSLSLCNGKWK